MTFIRASAQIALRQLSARPGSTYDGSISLWERSYRQELQVLEILKPSGGILPHGFHPFEPNNNAVPSRNALGRQDFTVRE
jgi:hypothetical protein